MKNITKTTNQKNKTIHIQHKTTKTHKSNTTKKQTNK